MGIDLSGVETALGVEEALETLGLEVYERRSDEADDDLDLGSEEDGDDAPSDAVDR
jgi:hypothetical protein